MANYRITTQQNTLRSAFRGFIVDIGALLFASWIVMLMIGVAHSVDGRIPDLGFVVVAVLLASANSAHGYLTYTSRRRS